MKTRKCRFFYPNWHQNLLKKKSSFMDDIPRREGGHSWCQNLGKDAHLTFGGFEI